MPAPAIGKLVIQRLRHVSPSLGIFNFAPHQPTVITTLVTPRARPSRSGIQLHRPLAVIGAKSPSRTFSMSAAKNQAAAPTAIVGDETVSYEGKDYKIVREGKASMLVPCSAVENKEGKGDEVQQVFYNPIQQFNRDLSVLAIRAHGEEVVADRKLPPRIRRKLKDNKRRRPDGEDENDRPAKVQVSEGAETGANGDAPMTSGAGTTTEEAGFSAEGPQPQPQPQPQPVPTAAGSDEPKKADTGEEAVEGGAEGEKQKPPPKFTILDALSASGLRALRFSHELPFVTSVTANDLTKSAAESIKLNVKHNGLEEKIQVSHDDAIAHMYRRIADDLTNRDSRGKPGKKNKYDVVDLDPYGTASPFLDAAVQSVRDDGGLLCVTCTDSSHWAGHCYAERSYSLYGSAPIKAQHSHEAGIRIILHAIAAAAARHGLHIEPLLSLSVDFYCRVFVRIRASGQAVSFLGGKTMVVYQCSGCGAWETQPMVRTRPAPKKKEGYFYKHALSQGPPADSKCRHCGSTMHLSGPMYAGPIHDPSFIQRILNLLPTADAGVYGTIPRIEGVLTTALEEEIPGPEPHEGLDPKEAEMARTDHAPFFVIPSMLAGAVNAQSMPETMFRGALLHLGYRVTRSHCKPGSIKTDAPWEALWFIMREWVKQKSPVKTEKIQPHMPAYKLLRLGEANKGQRAEDGQGTAISGETKTAGELQPGDGKANGQGTGAEDETMVETTEEDARKTLVFDDALARLGREKGMREGKGERKLVRYQLNPRANWGPLTRAKGK